MKDTPRAVKASFTSLPFIPCYSGSLPLPNFQIALTYTPYEFAAQLTAGVAELVPNKRIGEKLAPIGQEVRCLTDLYVQALYRPHQINNAEKAQAIQTWYQLRRRLWLAWLRRKG